MKAQAQGLSSAANRDGSATRGSVFGRRNAATRASSLSADGSGASSHRGRLATIALAIAAFALLALAPLSQAKVIVSGFGTSGTLGGQLSNPDGVAVNTSGAGGVARGTVYVVDGHLQRVQRFSPLGDFERLWGENVFARDERQLITLNGAIGGRFTLSFGPDSVEFTVVKSPSNNEVVAPEPETIRSALEALSSIGVGNVIVSGSPVAFTVRFIRALGGTDVPQMTADGSQLSGTPPISASASTIENGFGGPFAGAEICTVASQCKEGASEATASTGGQLASPTGIAVNQANGHVYVTETNNRRVSEFDAEGNFERAWGWDVVLSGRPGDVPGTSERQTVTLDATTTGGKFRLLFNGQGTGPLSFVQPLRDSNVLTEVRTFNGSLAVGQVITGFGIPDDTTITAVDIANATVTLSASLTSGSRGTGGIVVTAHDIPWDASPVQVQAALEAIPTIGAGNVRVTSANPGGGVLGGPYDVTFQGALADTDVDQITSSPDGLRATTRSVAIATTVEGVVGGFEICSDADDCKGGAAAGADGGRFASSSAGSNFIGHPIIDSLGNVWIPDPTNRRLQKFDSSGNFIAAYGYDVDARGGSGALEICTSTAPDFCQAGTSGSALGQFSANNPSRIAFDSSGNIYAIDDGNDRVQKFDPAFTSATNFGVGVFPAFTRGAPEGVVATQGGNRLTFSLFNNVSASGERQLVELDLAENVRDTSLVGIRLSGAINGLAEDSNTGNLYATTTASISPRKVLVLNSTPLAAPVPVMDPVTVKAATTATFSGTVDPRGGWVECKFQYSTDQRTWTDVTTTACDSLSFSAGAQAIRADVSGLSTNTQYFARLVISRPLDPSSTRTSLAKSFSTDHVAPIVSNVGVIEIADVSARMVGTINPNNSATAYVFQYGTTPALGSSTDPVDIGAGSRTLIVSQLIEGLRPATTYYFKLIATNLAGSASNTSQTFTTRTDSLPPPDGRRYEQVSPVDKSFGGVDFTPFPRSSAAPDGQAVAYCAGSGQPDDQVAGPCANYVSRRAIDGWQTGPLNPPVCSSGNIFQGMKAIPSLNLDYAVFLMPLQEEYCPTQPLDPAQPTTGAYAFYRESLLADPRTYDLIAPRAITDSADSEGRLLASTSDDAAHIVFPDSVQHTLDAPAGSFDKLYDWHNGSLSLVSKDPAGAPLTASSNVLHDAINGVSASGDRIFFQSPWGGVPDCGQDQDRDCELYLRDGGARTAWVSEEECSVACPDAGTRDIFEWASLDGARAVFRTEARLTDTDTQPGRDLYLYTHSANPSSDRNLTLLSKDNEPADGSSTDVIGVLGISESADTVYFAANGQLALGRPTAAGPKLYRWSFNGGSPTLDYLATLNRGEGKPPWTSTSAPYPAIQLVTPDGETLLVQVNTQLDPVADQDTDRDVYRWSEAEGWTCISCQTPGSPSAGDASIEGSAFEASLPSTGTVNREQRIVMSDDAERIYFTTPDALASGDVNGRIKDVYEWHDGAVNLISGGTGEKEALLVGTSRSGSDVLFITFERLVGWDTDGASDIYDARIGGGFPEPPPTGVPCEDAAACRGAGSVAPVVTGAGTRVFESQGNQQQRRVNRARCPRGKRKVTRNGRTRCVKRQRRNANNNRRTAR